MSYETRNGKIIEQYTKEGEKWWYILYTINKDGLDSELTRIPLDNPPSFIKEYEDRENERARKEKEFYNSCANNYRVPVTVETLVARQKRREKLKTSTQGKQDFLDELSYAETEEDMLRVFVAFGLEVEVEGEGL